MLINLPPSLGVNKREPVVLRESRSACLLPDLHFPYQNNITINAALTKADEEKVDTFIFTGDQLDFYMMSRWGKDPARASLVQELDAWFAFMSGFRSYFRTQRVLYIKGNHCMRLEAHINSQCKELKGLRGLDFAQVLELERYGVELVPDFCTVLMSGLWIAHGHELKISGGLSPAYNLWRKAKTHAVIGHLHRKSEYSAKSIAGKSVVAFTMGCCATLSPDYHPYPDHVGGFGINKGDGNKFEFRNHYVNEEGRVF